MEESSELSYVIGGGAGFGVRPPSLHYLAAIIAELVRGHGLVLKSVKDRICNTYLCLSLMIPFI